MSTSKKRRELLFAERGLFSAMQKLDPHLHEINRVAASEFGTVHLLILNAYAMDVGCGYLSRPKLDELIEPLAELEGLTTAALAAYADFQIAMTRYNQACAAVANSRPMRFPS